uniref:Triacylglycerol lipase n=1 Tax=Kalanchoe fedtschenkoi TaxID=63787 RepID=A0A7N0RJ54_KALFE
MSKRGAEEMVTAAAEVNGEEEAHHPYAYHVSGPRNVCSPNWRDLIRSSWKDGNYKRTVVACFIQAVYLLELDRQENRTEENALAPKWWLPFKYRLSKTLIDERDESIFGAILEWDHSAALADLIPFRPRGAPRAVLALRGTLLKKSTIRRDVQDDLRFLAWESLKGSVRFKAALDALKSLSDSYGSGKVCVAGHSLGAGFALQIGKELAKQGVYVETHLFNPPSVSLAMSFRSIGEKAESAWKRIKSMLPSNSETETQSTTDESEKVSSLFSNWIPDNIRGIMGSKKWVPNLYVNNSDYICCNYNDPADTEGASIQKENVVPPNNPVAAKLFILAKGKQKFLEAHGLEQWWSDDLQLQTALSSSKLISRQLKSLYSLPASLPSQLKPK